MSTLCFTVLATLQAILGLPAPVVAVPLSARAAGHSPNGGRDLAFQEDVVETVALRACRSAVDRHRAALAECAVMQRQQPPCNCYCPKCVPDWWPDLEKLPPCPTPRPAAQSNLPELPRSAKSAALTWLRTRLVRCRLTEREHLALLRQHCQSRRGLLRRQAPLPAAECSCFCPPCDQGLGPPPTCRPVNATSSASAVGGPMTTTTTPLFPPAPFTEYRPPPELPPLPPVGPEFLPTLAP